VAAEMETTGKSGALGVIKARLSDLAAQS
jgi:hypothetical protein